jgi:signal transduction histidine kinase
MLDASPDRAQETLRSIEGTGREALAELRRLLGLLRSEADGVNLAPQPRMSGVDALIAQFRDTGLAVDLRIEGEPHPMTAGLELTAYRF